LDPILALEADNEMIAAAVGHETVTLLPPNDIELTCRLRHVHRSLGLISGGQRPGGAKAPPGHLVT
jgi:hypothetical protein